jgi:hypothetical protein
MKVEHSTLGAQREWISLGCGLHCGGDRDRESTKERRSVECLQSGLDPMEGGELGFLL